LRIWVATSLQGVQLTVLVPGDPDAASGAGSSAVDGVGLGVDDVHADRASIAAAAATSAKRRFIDPSSSFVAQVCRRRAY
jgi:hypothetical protein